MKPLNHKQRKKYKSSAGCCPASGPDGQRRRGGEWADSHGRGPGSTVSRMDDVGSPWVAWRCRRHLVDFTSPKAINGFAFLKKRRRKKELQVSHSPQKYAPPKKKPIIWLPPAGLTKPEPRLPRIVLRGGLALAGWKKCKITHNGLDFLRGGNAHSYTVRPWHQPGKVYWLRENHFQAIIYNCIAPRVCKLPSDELRQFLITILSRRLRILTLLLLGHKDVETNMHQP